MNPPSWRAFGCRPGGCTFVYLYSTLYPSPQDATIAREPRRLETDDETRRIPESVLFVFEHDDGFRSNRGRSDGRSVQQHARVSDAGDVSLREQMFFLARRCGVGFDGKEQGGSLVKGKRKGKERKIIDNNVQDVYDRDRMLKGCPCTTTRVSHVVRPVVSRGSEDGRSGEARWPIIKVPCSG